MKTLLFDFDGVIHLNGEWKDIGIIEGEPVNGIKDCILELRKEYKVFIYSSRCIEKRGIEAIRKWIDKHEITVDGITDKKLSYASMIIDDRSINFNGSVSKLKNDIKNFKVWTER